MEIVGNKLQLYMTLMTFKTSVIQFVLDSTVFCLRSLLILESMTSLQSVVWVCLVSSCRELISLCSAGSCFKPRLS